MKFGEALEALKNGARVARAGWNGKGQWAYLMRGQSQAGYEMRDCLGICTVTGVLQPGWVPSQADMLCEDWEVLA